MKRNSLVVYAPVQSVSGYGAMSRDMVRHIIEMDRYDVHILSCQWGNTPMNALTRGNPKDDILLDRIVAPPFQLVEQPDVYLHIGIPTEAEPIGKFNIIATAGIETTLCSPEWIHALNRMDLIITISEHSKKVFENTVIEQRDQSGNSTGIVVKVEPPIVILHNCVDTNVFTYVNEKDMSPDILSTFDRIEEKFCFLFVGHWLQGNLREDRKNVGLLVHLFCETFKNIPQSRRPALILKTSGGNFSIMDQREVLDKIRKIRAISGPTAPNVYVVHGSLTDDEMNDIYHHPKVKVHINFTKGEGFGRPLLEASLSKKPIITSGWSGQLDFLNPNDAILVGGELKNIEPGAVWKGVLIPESQWFNVDEVMAKNAMLYAFNNYVTLYNGPMRLAKKNRTEFSYDAIFKKTVELFDKHVPVHREKAIVPNHIPFKLPALKKMDEER